MNEIIQIICIIAQGLAALFTVVAIVVKPIRYRLLGITERKKAEAKDELISKDAMKCLLRSEIVGIYYKHNRDGEMREYEFENLSLLYKAYKNLGGNSFVDKIWEEVQDWRIES